ncbi:MAG: hypothetical protein AAFZ09_00965 [Pseudomonadota bacterium]
MISLVFTVCLAGVPDSCDTRRIPIFEPVTPMACLMQAQPTLAQWRATHPGYRIEGWRCEAERPVVTAKPAAY